MTSSDTQHVDIVIVGTGLTESIVAAALQRHVQVLHVDTNPFYGNKSATVPLSQLLRDRSSSHINSLAQGFCIDIDNVDESERHRYLIDLAPVLLRARSKLVDLLVSSKTSRYIDFRLLDAAAILNESDGEDAVFRVPVTKEHIFLDKTVPLLEKRKVMKVLERAMKWNEDEQRNDIPLDEPFESWLGRQGLKQRLIDALIYAIALDDSHKRSELKFEKAMDRMHTFLTSIGRYGPSAFLVPLYGSAEFAQAFCRYAAVFGAMYMLNFQIENVSENDEDRKVVTLKSSSNENEEHFTFTTKKIIDLSQGLTLTYSYTIHRCVIITSEPAIKLKKYKRSEEATQIEFETGAYQILVSPPSELHPYATYFLQVNAESGHCPENKYVLYVWSRGVDGKLPNESLSRVIDRVTPDAHVLFRAFYQTTHSTTQESAFDTDICVTRAKELVQSTLKFFGKEYSEDTFIEAPIDPEKLNEVRELLESASGPSQQEDE